MDGPGFRMASMTALAQQPGGAAGAVIRFDGTREEEYEAWKFWASAYLRKKRRTDDETEMWINEDEHVVFSLYLQSW